VLSQTKRMNDDTRKRVRFNLPSPHKNKGLDSSPSDWEPYAKCSPFSSPSQNKKFKRKPPKSPGKSKAMHLHLQAELEDVEEEERVLAVHLFDDDDDDIKA
jgi:hypothetical protein